MTKRLIQKRIGEYISKNNITVSEKYRNTELGINLEYLLKQVYLKYFDKSNFVTKNIDWTMNDYNTFLLKLKSLPVPIYQKMFPYLNYLIDFTKKEIEEELRKLDLRLETHVFDDTRIPTFVETDDNDRIEQKYIFKQHEFTCADIIQFTESVHSKLLQTGIIAWQKYQNTILSKKDSSEKTEYLQLLLDLIYQKDEQVLSSILEPYHSWIKKIESHKEIYSLLKDREEEVLAIFKSQISSMLESIKEREELDIKKHNLELSYRIGKYQEMHYKRSQ